MQLVLPVSFRKQDGFDTFVTKGNEQLVSHLQSLQNIEKTFANASQRLSVLTGPQACGKTHLLLATCELAESLSIQHQYINVKSLQSLPLQMMFDLINASQAELICIDNLQIISGNKAWQIALFDSINLFIEQSRKLFVISTSIPLEQLDYPLLDLKTRLVWGTNFVVQTLNDEQKLLAIKKQLDALGMDSSHETISFLFNRISRDMHKLSEYIDILDKESLKSKRKLTIPFIKSVLSI